VDYGGDYSLPPGHAPYMHQRCDDGCPASAVNARTLEERTAAARTAVAFLATFVKGVCNERCAPDFRAQYARLRGKTWSRPVSSGSDRQWTLTLEDGAGSSLALSCQRVEDLGRDGPHPAAECTIALTFPQGRRAVYRPLFTLELLEGEGGISAWPHDLRLGGEALRMR
jgi:hypothetical protein